MYKAFAETEPLPRDGNLMDYGVKESDLIVGLVKKQTDDQGK